MKRSCRVLMTTAIAVVVWSLSISGLGRQTSAGPCDIVSSLPGVCLDPGHGGPNAGKLRPPYNNGDGENNNAGSCGPIHIDPDTCVNEAWVNHEIVPLARESLQSETHVAVTRQVITEDLTYTDRCYRANNDPEVDAFISVHHEGNTDVDDTRTYYYAGSPTSDWSYMLAEALADKIDEQFHYGKQVKTESFFVLRNTWMPSALTEASCIGHMSEALLMASDDDSHRRAEAQGIVNGLFSYDWDTAPMSLTCRDLWPFPGFEFSWWAVEGADGYVLYVYEDMFPFICPSTEPIECYVVEAATSCILFSFPGSPAIAVRP